METKKVKLKSGLECSIVEMSIDAMDECSDTPEISFDSDNNPTTIRNLAKARTKWLRAGIKDCTDKFLKTLTDEDKSELVLLIQEFQRLGEAKPSG